MLSIQRRKGNEIGMSSCVMMSRERLNRSTVKLLRFSSSRNLLYVLVLPPTPSSCVHLSLRPRRVRCSEYKRDTDSIRNDREKFTSASKRSIQLLKPLQVSTDDGSADDKLAAVSSPIPFSTSRKLIEFILFIPRSRAMVCAVM